MWEVWTARRSRSTESGFFRWIGDRLRAFPGGWLRKQDRVEVARLTIGEEFRRSGITPEQLGQLLEEAREEVFPRYLRDHYDHE